LKESYDIVPGDQVMPYALFVNGHDGTTRLRVLPTTVRVVCANTLSIATDRDRLGMTMRHDGKLDNHIRSAQSALGLVYSAVERNKIEAQELARKQMRSDRRIEYIANCVKQLDFNEDRERIVISEVVNLLDASTNNGPLIRGTAWAVYNAFSEWVDHTPRKIANDVRLESNWMGEGHKIKSAAWSLALAS
jgi:phage/plasmid-like protein (TIGR03299 family)